MVELGQLEKNHEEFTQRGVAVFVVSPDELEDAKRTKSKFPHLNVVSDANMSLSRAVHAVHPGMAPGGKDTNAPTTLLINSSGEVRWVFRPDRFLERLPAAELLKAINQHLGPAPPSS